MRLTCNQISENTTRTSTTKVTKSGRTITVHNEDNTREDRTFFSTINYKDTGEIEISNSFTPSTNIESEFVSKSYNVIAAYFEVNGSAFIGKNFSIGDTNDTILIFDDNSTLPAATPLAVGETTFENINYYPDGTITIHEHLNNGQSNFYTTGNLTKYSWPISSYNEVLKQNPIQNNNDAAKSYINMNKELLNDINKDQLNNESILVFTADYGLYWWDYQSGYDCLLAELAWNNSITQEIGLVRGAANLQNKSWGTILTWKYTQPPYLTDGQEMYQQMKTSYETGAEYVIIFNYSENPANPNTLQEEHFQALERFWHNVVKNPLITHGHIKAKAALVLPENYGWGIRHPNDNIWGIWPADDTSQEIWNQIQDKIDQHGLKLDIIFEDPNYHTENYKQIYHWNQK